MEVLHVLSGVPVGAGRQAGHAKVRKRMCLLRGVLSCPTEM